MRHGKREYSVCTGFEETVQRLHERLKEKERGERSEKMDLKEQCSSFEGKAGRLAGWQAGTHR